MSYALITGASKGIGKAIAFELAARKIDLLLVARSESLLQALGTELSDRFGIQTHYLAIDLAIPSSPAAVADWIAQNGYPVHILVNNAGFGIGGAFDSQDPAIIRDMMQVNMQVPVELCSLLLPELKKYPQSHILNIASAAAYQAVPGLVVYAATKSFLLSFSRGLQYELRKTPVSVTAVSPGGTSTEFASTAQLGAKAVKAGEKLNMTAEAVAKLAVNAMFSRKTELITGTLNKIGAAMVWLLPKSIAEKAAAGIYEIK
jgi:short-subunit dehydrogenase